MGKGWRPATVSPLCGFCEMQDVCKLDLLSNETCGITMYRRGSIFSILVQEMAVCDVPSAVL